VNSLIQYYGINNLYFFISYSFFGVFFNLKITNFKKVKEIQNKAKNYSKKNN